ncbi:MAG TPA: antitoxin Xre-like helix-turn-helix domain-containing protein [Thermoanaerobaculia bacterium]|jgi:putative toxin-antitoxin system antitoxin component (TIGR02293 family)|nr:antitoxin Xre-like helix-turn-helix domain-containing protein [Thermoanaerobaculia bacterium]
MDAQLAGRKDVQRYRVLYLNGRPGPQAYVVLLGLDTFELPALIRAIGRGLPWKALQRFVKNTGLTTEQVAELVGIPPRTLARRKVTGRLAADESDRLVRAARLYGRALDLFDGDPEAATAWLTHRNTALGGIAPIEYARTGVGTEEVDALIGRIEYGTFS